MTPSPEQIAAVVSFLEANGWTVVPVSPTEAMLQNGWYGAHDAKPDEAWDDMLAAAPTTIQIQGRSVELSRAGNKSKDGL